MAGLAALLAVAACDGIDPYRREGAWHPVDVNSANLRAMGARARPVDGALAAAALSRLRHDRVRPLLDSGLARVVPVAGAAPAQQPPASRAGTGE